MAGFADGEGCIHIGKAVNKRAGREYIHYQLTFHVSQKTQASVARFRDAFGGTLGIEYRKGKPYWYWRASGTAASEALKQLLPFIFTKRVEAENAIAFQDYLESERKVRTKGKRGSGYSADVKSIFHDYHVRSKALNQGIEQLN
jgi:hypothetical protein